VKLIKLKQLAVKADENRTTRSKAKEEMFIENRIKKKRTDN